ncbi:MAG: accessory factor UbiK family protein [Gammaproteobacteria bacterium]
MPLSKPNLDHLAEQLRALLPGSVGPAQEEIRASLKVFLESMLARMNLVTREEFDAQAALLARTREKLEQLEALVAELERPRE